ncbi:XdhC family protein, partial [Glaciimonas sp. GG7]
STASAVRQCVKRCILVMTHNHALDQRLSELILQRDDVGWFGLIGSKTKRMQFEHRLRERGITDERLTEMVCPIGITGIVGKEPAVIAVAVVAQLLQVWEHIGRTVPVPEKKISADYSA